MISSIEATLGHPAGFAVATVEGLLKQGTGNQGMERGMEWIAKRGYRNGLPEIKFESFFNISFDRSLGIDSIFKLFMYTRATHLMIFSRSLF